MLGKRALLACETDDDPTEKRAKLSETWPDWVVEANHGKQLKTRTFKPIAVYKPVGSSPKPGGIRVLRIYNRFSKVDAELKKWPSVPGYERYNVCKNNKYQALSPMVLGPVYDENGELFAENVEDAWQCSKVFTSHLNGCSVDSMEWVKNWQEWSKRGRFSKEARRHRQLQRGDQTLFSYYMGDKLTYVQARKRMYCRWYQQTVVETDAFKDLKARHMDGIDLLLLEYDGLDRNDPEQNKDLDRESLHTFLNDPHTIFGHGLVLACLLLDLPLWEEETLKQDD
mmetsp:Transcript_25072/g.31901  ORF Transcript_25072/g.31901 Transcript_25072/m.31901 type:complete len:283 (-) Transcript_25072:93-941(-)